MCQPDGEKAAAVIAAKLSRGLSRKRAGLFLISQTAAVGPAVTSQRLSALNAAPFTAADWRRGAARWRPVAASQTRASPSLLVVTTRRPFGLKDADVKPR